MPERAALYVSGWHELCVPGASPRRQREHVGFYSSGVQSARLDAIPFNYNMLPTLPFLYHHLQDSSSLCRKMCSTPHFCGAVYNRCLWLPLSKMVLDGEGAKYFSLSYCILSKENMWDWPRLGGGGGQVQGADPSLNLQHSPVQYPMQALQPASGQSWAVLGHLWSNSVPVAATFPLPSLLFLLQTKQNLKR